MNTGIPIVVILSRQACENILAPSVNDPEIRYDNK